MGMQQHLLSLRYSGAHTGSSPLARGTRPKRYQTRARYRFIPARAGNTRPTTDAIVAAPVHPRSRGEHGGAAVLIRRLGGSSPLARGTPGRRRGLDRRPRFIPARAGNTVRVTCSLDRHTVHPRSRGEHDRRRAPLGRCTGSSPLARGTLQVQRDRLADGRFIPARAGNTSIFSRQPPVPAVHPRSRGEHLPSPRELGDVAGSSPLARGTPRRSSPPCRTARFIPARAGNTSNWWMSTEASPVHPRSRGEHLDQVVGDLAADGSSPLARGTLRTSCRTDAHGRFIPARAGNTPVGALRARAVPVHPRSRGEHQGPVGGRPGAAGSSPLARGTRRAAPTVRRPPRFIPARAGNT